MNQGYLTRFDKIMDKAKKIRRYVICSKAYKIELEEKTFCKLPKVEGRFIYKSPSPSIREAEELKDSDTLLPRANSGRASQSKVKNVIKHYASDESIGKRRLDGLEKNRFKIKTRTNVQSPRLFFEWEKKNAEVRYKESVSLESLAEFDN